MHILAALVVHQVTTVAGAPVHSLVIPAGAEVRPVARRPGRTVSGFRAAAGAVAAINGGFFNHSDGWPVSHVTAAGRALGEPLGNRALLDNPALRPHLDTILNRRSAWFAGPGGWAIAPWATPPAGWTDGLQAGPRLLPTPALAAEAFVLGARDGIGSHGRAARSALGLRADGAMVWAVAGRPGLTIAGLAAAMKGLGCVEAMALDGGSSSALAWTENGKPRVFVGGGGGEALVNSALILR